MDYNNDKECIFCGQEDTLRHRVHECPGTEHIRESTTEWEQLKSLPDYVLLGGLFPKPQKLKQFQKALMEVDVQISPLPSNGSTRFFFTDGSAQDEGIPLARVASWGVTEAQPQESTNHVISSGILPGMIQTVFRAELFAVNVALAYDGCCEIFCDNQAAVKVVQAVINGNDTMDYWVTHPDRDLIQTTINILKRKQPGSCKIFWTKAHKSLHDARDFSELWQIFHNNRADILAKQALHSMSDELRKRRNDLVWEFRCFLKTKLNSALLLRRIFDEFP